MKNRRNLLLHPVIMIVGVDASESEFNTSPVSSCINWYLKVILTLRTWTVWHRNEFLSPILYTLCWGSSLILEVRYHSSTTCEWKFHAHSCLSGWLIAKQSFLRHIQDSRDVSRYMLTKKLFSYGSYCLSGMVVSINVSFNIPPLIGKVVLLMLMLIPAIQACEETQNWFGTSHILNLRSTREKQFLNDSGVWRR